MAENVLEQIVSELRNTAPSLYPNRSELRNVRVVGHTPKTDHYIYDIVIDFADASERAYAKVYKASKTGAQTGKAAAKQETTNLQTVHKLCEEKKISGVPRPLGDFSALGAVVAEKLVGIPLQSIILKAALLPGYNDLGILRDSSRNGGQWLKAFHGATAANAVSFDGSHLVTELERLCHSCRSEGLDDVYIEKIVSGAKSVMSKERKTLPESAVLNDYCPLNIVVTETGVGFCEFSTMSAKGNPLDDAAVFLASVEALEKYPFCNRKITVEVQDEFLQAYGASEAEHEVLRVLKMKHLLSMFAQGRSGRESALRKRAMWANVMKRFIQQATDRSLAPAA